MASKNLKFGELEVCINWVIAICVLLTMSGLIRLGIWQLSRAQEKIHATPESTSRINRAFLK
jgi:cytochrome oxidase assembly protein ShyY1